jgi:hypothetical protein
MKTFVEVPIKNGVAIELRDPTPEEMKEAQDRRDRLIFLTNQINSLRKELHDLGESCPHVVCYDEEGYIYDNRHCYGCNLHKGIV